MWVYVYMYVCVYELYVYIAFLKEHFSNPKLERPHKNRMMTENPQLNIKKTNLS